MSETWLTTATTRTWRSLCLEVGDRDLAELATCEQHRLECCSRGVKGPLDPRTGASSNDASGMSLPAPATHSRLLALMDTGLWMWRKAGG
jgi:hypothetical protein